MICPDCNVEPFETTPNEWECLCGQEEVIEKRYINTCHHCIGGVVDSWNPNCKKSVIPGMGYHCMNCGEDLRIWKVHNHMISFNALQAMELQYEGEYRTHIWSVI